MDTIKEENTLIEDEFELPEHIANLSSKDKSYKSSAMTGSSKLGSLLAQSQRSDASLNERTDLERGTQKSSLAKPKGKEPELKA